MYNKNRENICGRKMLQKWVRNKQQEGKNIEKLTLHEKLKFKAETPSDISPNVLYQK